MLGADRISCVVVGCRRTAPRKKFPNSVEIICGPCGARVRDVRKVYRRARKRLHRDETENNYRAVARIWAIFKRKATEAALGIG